MSYKDSKPNCFSNSAKKGNCGKRALKFKRKDLIFKEISNGTLALLPPRCRQAHHQVSLRRFLPTTNSEQEFLNDRARNSFDRWKQPAFQSKEETD